MTHPTADKGLLTFWDFQEPAGEPRRAVGRYDYALHEMNGPVQRGEDGIFGPYCADLQWGQWFRARRADAPGLNLHGSKRPLSMAAWVQRRSDRCWQYIAGVWDEGDERFRGQPTGVGERAPGRQYALFLSGAWQNDCRTYERTRAEHQVHGYVSPQGGATPGYPYAFDYATGATRIAPGRWTMIAYTFDGQSLRVYVDGQLDANGGCNPFAYDGPIHNGAERGADFTVAQRNHPQWPSYPHRTPDNAEGFDGRIAGLAVYDRALTPAEIEHLHEGALTGCC